ncbi:MAG TPA: gas vesicle protein GvpJ [Candidatus Angelobacter sp.]
MFSTQTVAEARVVRSSFKTHFEHASLIDILDRILDKGIVVEPWARVVLGVTDLRAVDNRIAVAPERRRKTFVLPIRKGKY